MSVSELEFSKYVKDSETTPLLTKAALDAGFLGEIFEDRQKYIKRAVYAINAANIGCIGDLDALVAENFNKIELFLRTLKKNTKGEKIDGWRVWIEFVYELAVIALKPDIFTHEYQQHNHYESIVILIVEKSIKDIRAA